MKRLWLWWSVVLIGLAGCVSRPTPQAGIEMESDLKTSIDISRVYFNSREDFYKSPFGAVVEGTPVRFRIQTKKGDVKSVEFLLYRQEKSGTGGKKMIKSITNLPMRVVMTTNGLDIWEITYTPEKPMVYGYGFRLVKNERDVIVYANNRRVVEVPYNSVVGTGGIGRIQGDRYPVPYTLTVYRKDFVMPSWTSNMVIYYIFPDRFRNGNKKNDPIVGKRLFYNRKPIEFHTNWWDPYPYVPGPADKNTTDDNEYCNDFYGGDLEGIIEKLDYLASLGVTVIYINPIFEAPSNHKYDTADYMKIDPAFGDLETFRRLVSEAKKRGIRIILDTSLNHCGSDSVYMDRYGKYPTLGAFENETIRKDSPYYEWFLFKPNFKKPDEAYDQWANPTLATLREVDSYKEFAYRGTNSVTRYWLRQGASGWRMDVTPWKSDDFWREWRKAVKETDPEAFTIAEVWFDASFYFLGDMYDSTMNYLFRSAMIQVGLGTNLTLPLETLEMMRENYPPQVFYRLMNLISSHDLPRMLYELGYKRYGQEGYETFKRRFQLVVAFQFAFPGAPTIYYGDEIGMTGGGDPFNRGPYPWTDTGAPYGDPGLVSFFQTLGKLRHTLPVLSQGDLTYRHVAEHTLVFERRLKESVFYFAMNNGTQKATITCRELEGNFVDPLTGENVSLKGEIVLGPKEFRYLVKR
ncbi:MAG: glycoside hydrolase family 13 protein [Brevinematales bacterium]|nr:glycoside hydrolase family 13 protein [Brevinematales bacterium]